MKPRATRAAERFLLELLLFVSAASLGCSRREPPPPPPPPAPLEVDQEILNDAMHQCFTVDCDRAHERAKQISRDSPLRQTDVFHAIEFRFEVNELLRAERETDVDKQRSMLEAIRNMASADPELRTAAAQMLARSGGGPRFELTLAGQGDGGTDAGNDAGRSDAALIASLMKSKKPEDYAQVRALIEPRIYSGKASPEDVRTMLVICKAQKDARCLKTIKTFKFQ